MKVAVIIPAYNEEKTIGGILETLKRTSGIYEIIVVNDGSKDQTSEKAKSYQVTVLDLPLNRGKGGALLAGTRLTDAPILLFFDADLVGLTSSHVEQLLQPILQKGKAMSLGLIDRGELVKMSADFFLRRNLPWPTLTGQRAILRSVFEQIPGEDLKQYGIEVALNEFCRERRLPVEFVHLDNLSHVMKEKKMGVWKGLAARLRMFWNVAYSFVKIRSR